MYQTDINANLLDLAELAEASPQFWAGAGGRSAGDGHLPGRDGCAGIAPWSGQFGDLEQER
jgi:hypothetical protein